MSSYLERVLEQTRAKNSHEPEFLQAVEEIAPNENANLIFTDTGVILSGHISSTGTKEKIKDMRAQLS